MYNSSKNLDKKKEAWIFLSHSSKDLPKVRLIRNYIERLGHRPSIFHLKFMESIYDNENTITKNFAEDFTFLLIKHEIEASSWFIYCKSNNTENNDNVHKELKIMADKLNRTSTKMTAAWTLDLDINGDWPDITHTNDINAIPKSVRKKILEFLGYLGVFFIYSGQKYKDIVYGNMEKPGNLSFYDSLLEYDDIYVLGKEFKDNRNLNDQDRDELRKQLIEKSAFSLIIPIIEKEKVSKSQIEWIEALRNERKNYEDNKDIDVLPIIIGNSNSSIPKELEAWKDKAIKYENLNDNFDDLLEKIKVKVKDRIISSIQEDSNKETYEKLGIIVPEQYNSENDLSHDYNRLRRFILEQYAECVLDGTNNLSIYTDASKEKLILIKGESKDKEKQYNSLVTLRHEEDSIKLRLYSTNKTSIDKYNEFLKTYNSDNFPEIIKSQLLTQPKISKNEKDMAYWVVMTLDPTISNKEVKYIIDTWLDIIKN